MRSHRNSMRSDIFWTLTCLLTLLATVLFSGWAPAAPVRAKPAAPVKAKLKAEAVVVRLGTPYRAELRRKLKAPRSKTQSFSPAFLRREDLNAQYLQWRNSVRFLALPK